LDKFQKRGDTLAKQTKKTNAIRINGQCHVRESKEKVQERGKGKEKNWHA